MLFHPLYRNLKRQFEQLRPNERATRARNWIHLMMGIYLSASVHLSKIAEKVTPQAKLPSGERRLRRFLDNSAVRVRPWYAPIARCVLGRIAAGGGPVRLLLDGTKVGPSHQLLMVAVAYRRRALPLAWTWVRKSRGHSSARKQCALLSYVRSLIEKLPGEIAVEVMGDSEFGAVAVQEQLEEWNWHYVLRQKGSHLVQEQEQEGGPWRRLDSFLSGPDTQMWLENARLTRQHAHQTHLLLHWSAGEREPWLLATNLPEARRAHTAYGKRMWIEEMFGDFKRHGFDLESTHLRHFARLSRLTLAVAMLYVALIDYGARLIKRGHRHLVDRNDRRDYSLFRLGCHMVERLLARWQEPLLRLIPNALPKLSGS